MGYAIAGQPDIKLDIYGEGEDGQSVGAAIVGPSGPLAKLVAEEGVIVRIEGRDRWSTLHPDAKGILRTLHGIRV